jgi:hypothetical protein
MFERFFRFGNDNSQSSGMLSPTSIRDEIIRSEHVWTATPPGLFRILGRSTHVGG